MTFRTPLEQALQTSLPLEMDDVLAGDYDTLDALDAQAEAEAVMASLELGDFLAGLSELGDFVTGQAVRS